MALKISAGLFAIYALHLFHTYAEERGWIYYRKNRGTYGGLHSTTNFLNMYDPSRKHLQEAVRESEWKRGEIVASLMAGGLSKVSAERFVDRELGPQLPPLEPLIPSSSPLPIAVSPVEDTVQPAQEPVEAPAGTMSEGPGTMYEGPPAGGPDQIDQFLTHSQDDVDEDAAKRDRPFPWARVAALAAIPILSFPVIFIAVGVLAIQFDMSAKRESFDDVTGTVSQVIRRQAGDAYERRQRRNDESVEVIAEKLQTFGWQCDVAGELARTQSSRAVDPLIRYLQMNRAQAQTQVCIVDALVELGEVAPAVGTTGTGSTAPTGTSGVRALSAWARSGPTPQPKPSRC